MRMPACLRTLKIALLLSAILMQAQAAYPQTAGVVLPPPPEIPQIDETGTDVIAGNPNYTKEMLDIGPAGPMGLVYELEYTGVMRTNLFGIFHYDYFSSGSSSGQASFGNLGQSMVGATFYNGGGPWMGFGSDGTGMVDNSGNKYYYGQTLLSGTCYTCSTSFTTTSAISKVEFSNGAIWNFYYKVGDYDFATNSYRLQSVVSNTGYQLKFEYFSDNYGSTPEENAQFVKLKKITAINNAYEYCDPAADHCSLTGAWDSVSASSSGNNISVEDPSGETWTYADSTISTGSLSVTPPSGSSPVISYAKSYLTIPGASPYNGANNGLQDYRVISANVHGVSVAYGYQNVNSSNQTWRVTRTDPSGSRTYESRITPARAGGPYLEVRPGVTKYVDELGGTSLFEYDSGDRLTKATYPEGNWVEYVPAANRPTDIIYHAKDGATSTVHQVFPDCPNGIPDKVCHEPTSITDPRGNATAFTYAPEHGGVLTRTDPVDANGVHPVTRYSYSQHYAWYKNSTGAIAQAASPIWLLDSERSCMTTATTGSACAGGSSDEVVTTYDYGIGNSSHPNNLLLRGVVVASDGETRRACYAYDTKGNKISETEPRADLASCP